ncbi:NucA/NucB deoxyribonuclease domain-containing protein [Actinomadura nitritigenes]|uniref:NucA/NucB deoxyribonuclease domain-containing protein n=1 Tax=Actinomadura nitritigenes TaxID=134602 RepID=UPI003D8A8320
MGSTRAARRRLLTGIIGTITLLLAMGAVPANADQEKQLVLTSGLATGARYVNNPDLIFKDLESGTPVEKLGGEKSATSKVPAPQEAKKQQEESRHGYTAKMSDYATPKSVADDDSEYDYPTAEECRAHSESGQAGGWFKNRYSFCHRAVAWAKVQSCLGNVCIPPIGEAEIGIMIIGKGRKGPVQGTQWDRYVKFETYIESIKLSGPFTADDALWTTKLVCQGLPDSSCVADASTQSEWTGKLNTLTMGGDFPLLDAQFISPGLESMKENGNQLAHAVVQSYSHFTLPDADLKQVDSPWAKEADVRFDSAWYADRALGSIFPWATPWIKYDGTGASPYPQGAEHVRYALTNPTLTIPNLPSKKIPGGSWGDPIHRLYQDYSDVNKTRYNSNNYYAREYGCKIGWPDYTSWVSPEGEPYECDEFPFRSTYEGAARFKDEYDGPQYTNWFSARPIPKSDNGNAGTVLKNWYRNDRILDGDPFYVVPPAAP